MANAKILPSGNWRVRVFSHKDATGKKHYESFTASTRTEAEMLASQFANKKHRIKNSDLTVAEAIDGYITAKTNVLSPSTIRGYRKMQRNNFDLINNKKIKRLTNEEVQLFISQISIQMSPKSTKNIYSLLTASIALYAPDIIFRVTLPSTVKRTAPAPSNDNVIELFNAASPWMKKCIALAAFGGLRCGEVAALKYGDITDNSIFIHADMILDENNNWIYKDMPKNQNSIRTIKVPTKVIQLLGKGNKNDYVIGYNSNAISKMFVLLKNKVGCNIRFHDLRHYYASIGAVLNIPDIYLADFGGWRHDSTVMKSVYQGNITSIADGYSKQMNDYFDNILNSI